MADNISSLPDDPLKIPPPYWRSAATIFHVLRSLHHLTNHLAKLVPLNLKTDTRLNEYFNREPKPEKDDPEFGKICIELWDLEHQIKLATDSAVLMSAISAEDRINCFCVYNLHHDIVEPLEKLSPPEKLQVASAIVGHPGIKGQHPFNAIQQLTSWRNSFAHGHCTDRPTKSLRHNHLISPNAYPGVPDSVDKCVRLIRGYLVLSRYLASISKNPYTSGNSEENQEIEVMLNTLDRYEFKGTPALYTVTYK